MRRSIAAGWRAPSSSSSVRRSGAGVELVETARHAEEDALADRCVLERLPEGGLGEHRQRQGIGDADGRVAWCGIEERELAEEVAGPEASDFGSAARHHRVAAEDDEELDADVAFGHDRFARFRVAERA